MKVPHSPLSFLRLLSWVACFLACTASYGQRGVKVIDASDDNAPLAGVQIHNTDYSITGITDVDGNWTIPQSFGNQDTLHFVYVGYEEALRTLSDIINTYDHVYMFPGLALEEVTIVGRTDQLATEMIHKVETISQKEILKTQSQNSADALGQNADVYIQKSQAGGGSPVIRGFEANKVLLVIDGVRMNNAIYRSGHLQNAITVDNAMLKGIEVIYGPGSLVYGSDALGGVIHFRSKDPIRNFNANGGLRLMANASVSYASANQKKGTHLDFNIGGRKWGSLTSLTYNDFGDLRSGSHRPSKYPTFGNRDWYVTQVNLEDVQMVNDDPGLQIGTGYQQFDLTQKFIYEVSPVLDVKANFQYSSSSNVPRYDALSELSNGEPRYAVWNYGPQKRMLASVQAVSRKANPFYDNAKFIAAYQDIKEERITRRFKSSDRETQLEAVKVATFTMDMTKYLDQDEKIEIQFGLEYNRNNLASTATREDIISRELRNDIFTRYPSGGGTTDALGAYLLSSISNNAGTRLFGGLRYTSNGIYVTYDIEDAFKWPKEFYEGMSTDNQALTWSLGIRQDLPSNWTLQALLGSAFRSPNIDDLAKVRIKSDELSVPNLELTPEKSINAELTISKSINGWSASATGFYTGLTDAVVRQDFQLPDGSTYFLSNGDTLRIVGNVNAAEARIIGVSVNSLYKINKTWQASGSMSITQGKVKEDGRFDQPLAHIPPTYGRLALRYQKSKYDIEARYVFNQDKPLDEYGGSTDNPELATADGTYAWSTLNLYSDIRWTEDLTIRAGIENLFDKHYRPFASGVSGAGRNLILSVNYSFR